MQTKQHPGPLGQVAESRQVALIGLGLLGTALAERLLRAGFAVAGYDPDPAASARLQSIAGAPLATAVAAAESASTVFLSLPGPLQVRATIDAIEDSLQPGSIVLDTTTGNPVDVEAVAARLAARGVAYLDCEVGGSSKQLLAGEAILICGGHAPAFQKCREILAALSDRVFHTGAAGTGTRMKLALNIAIGLHRAVLAESLEFARANGIEPERALEILRNSPAYSKAMDVKGHKMLSGDFSPDARLAQHLKDVGLILEIGSQVGARLPLSQLHQSLLNEAVDLGFAAEDNSAILKVFRRGTAREGN